MDTELKMGITDLPVSVFDDIQTEIWWYSVGLLKYKNHNEGEDENVNLIGSGTLIELDGFYGILTAQHVTALLKNDYKLGLTIKDQVHRNSWDGRHLEIHEIAKPVDPALGPDLAIIILPKGQIGSLKAVKSFYNLSQNKNIIEEAEPEFDRGVWVLFGCLEEGAVEKRDVNGFFSVKGFNCIFGLAPIKKFYFTDSYDYYEVGVKYGHDPTIPGSFGGMSGGGLWQVRLIKMKNGDIKIKKPILSGVAFYQTDIINGIRYIKCHGRQSIYNLNLK